MSPGRLIAVLLALPATLAPADAQAQEPLEVRSVTSREPDELAESLGILHEDSAAVLVLAAEPYDLVRIGFEGAPGSVGLTCLEEAPELPEDPLPRRALGPACVRAVVGPTVPGYLDVGVRREGVSWEGSLLLTAGGVAVLDVERLLRLADRTTQAAPEAAEFDILAFYGKLDARETSRDKARYCRLVLAGLEGGDHREQVREACERVAALAQQEASAEVLPEDDFETLSDPLDRAADDATLPLLYRRDGRPRVQARGTIPRALGIVAAAAVVGIGTAGAFYWEVRAEERYLAYRQAERVGDDEAMTEHLFFTRNHDRSRDASIAAAALAGAAGVGLAIAQVLEGRAFDRARSAREAGVQPSLGGGPGGVYLGLQGRFPPLHPRSVGPKEDP